MTMHLKHVTLVVFSVAGLLLAGCGQVSSEEAQTMAQQPQALESGSPCYGQTGTGTYEGYLCGNNRPQFIETRNLECQTAYSNCVANARNNPSESILCTWNGRVLYRRETSTGGSCDEVECQTATALGDYNGYFCEGNHNFIQTPGITCRAAFRNCVLNANLNPSNSVYCEWKSRVIYRKDLSLNYCGPVAASTPL
jgi:hypothetical protein